MTMQPIPGEALLTGQVDGRHLGNAILQFLPALPGEGPPFMPRALAKAIFPRGFAPGMIAALPAELPQLAPLLPPAGIPSQPIQPANQVPAQPVAAAPQPAVKIIPQPAARRTRDASAHERIQPTSHRVRIVERKGL